MLPASELKSILATLLILGMWAFQATSRELHDEASMAEKHELWMAKYGRAYKDSAEKEERFEIFMDNVQFIESFNRAANRSYKLSINHFADLTNDEFKAFRNGHKHISSHLNPSNSMPFRYEDSAAEPSAVDWRKKGVVTAIKDQGTCKKGYIRMQRDIGAKEGLCGIAMEASYPTA
ncbi:unnamed protein product [Thlaspi arvense]|uniref:Cathepsin propeptide inhibitor domain-containing protein n=1 Tax=Thlaspi arvense TaxID=13288 RepID=A0AAU9RFV4_THLAR|nr:unnamed protein product [Thlaspi arvense]